MTTNLFINKRIKKARIEAGFRYVTDLHKRLNEIYMPISYKRLTQLEREITMPTLYELDALHMATGADPNQLLIGQKRSPLLQEIHELTANLTKGQINHIMKLNAAMVPVVREGVK